MKWSLNELRQTVDEPLTFSETLDLKDALMSRNSDIIDVSPVRVKGIFSVDELGVCGYCEVETSLVLPSSRSLEAAEVPLSFSFTEHYVSQHEHDLSRFEDADVVMVLPNDILDFDGAVCDNILLQIPMQVLTATEQSSDRNMPSGTDWSVVSESQLKEARKDEDGVDPRLAGLKDFFKDSDENP